MISCTVALHDSSIPYFIASHILRTLLANCGYSMEVEQEEILLEQMSEESVPYLYLLNDVAKFSVSCDAKTVSDPSWSFSSFRKLF